MRRELGHDLEVLRQTSDRKLEEMERANRKLMDQLHEDKKELARLKEVSTSIFDYKEGIFGWTGSPLGLGGHANWCFIFLDHCKQFSELWFGRPNRS